MKIKLKNLVLALVCVSSISAFSQEEKVDTLNVHEQRITSVEDGIIQIKKLKFSGYIQAQWQSTQVDSLGKGTKDMKVGTAKNAAETTNYNRYGIRRGRLKATYDDLGCQGVIELDINEKGVAVKDAYLNVLDPWIGYFAVKGGVYDRPFGYEVAYSSSKLESPERSRITQTLFPDEKDLGGMLTLQAPKTSPWSVLKLEAGLFAGNGISQDTKSKKDFIGHLTYNNVGANFKYGFGVSLYEGSILQPTKFVYSMNNGAFAVDSAASNKNGFAKREYIGFDGQFTLDSELGISSVRAEYIFGTQPGSSTSSNSPNATTVVTADTYLRKFRGGYVHFIQDIAGTKHSFIVKYDWYNPNTDVSGKNVGSALTATQKTAKNIATGLADIAYSTLGLGYMYRMTNNVRLMAYYDIVSNAKSSLKGYFNNVSDNLFTLRLQYKF